MSQSSQLHPAAAQQVNRIATQAYEKLNESVPVFAPAEWVIARHELGLLCRITHADRKPIYRPTPMTFGGVGVVNDIQRLIAHGLNGMQGIGDPVFQRLRAATEALDNLRTAYERRRLAAQEMGGVTVPLHIPAGLIPQANHFGKWFEGDGAECLRSWSIAGPGPDLTPMPLKF